MNEDPSENEDEEVLSAKTTLVFDSLMGGIYLQFLFTLFSKSLPLLEAFHENYPFSGPIPDALELIATVLLIYFLQKNQIKLAGFSIFQILLCIGCGHITSVLILYLLNPDLMLQTIIWVIVSVLTIWIIHKRNREL